MLSIRKENKESKRYKVMSLLKGHAGVLGKTRRLDRKAPSGQNLSRYFDLMIWKLSLLRGSKPTYFSALCCSN